MDVKQKTIIVTGANGGMGLAVVHQLLNEGAQVVGCDLNRDQLDSIQHHQLSIYEGNLLDEDFVRRVFQETNDRCGKIDGLVNAAGIAQQAEPIENVSVETWENLMDINMKLLFLTCREAAKYMKAKQRGSIVNVASISAVRPRPGLQAYVASKGGAESFSRALAIELAENNVRVNTVHPGPCDTTMLEKFAAEGVDIEKAKDETFKKSVPLGKLLTPENIASSIIFLLSDQADMVTGAALNVDGGRGI
ncbi:3-oxoacyl-[acyl-carrier-protein] reductase FabG [Halobacillus andaensis]|uniref:3-oxoacyl-[acyl-carrier-protein] reductase FabG n=1 Tax=Halobacillus andaensis TaxID=1176239 RepID=A0A917B7D9_HALAA|nr:SDR family oxidoreductase [Halobacillus andaensis]MBP2005207.1 3-oxoacyl-[acyl-carrier protein] reductase [Halobacillus andaensis]GGF29668.1 3-oxoacyl-[acyl-carrier-protein] reductase FabG [Halobacillus andaensis]